VRPKAHIHTFHSFFRHFQLLNLNLPLVEKFAEIRSLLRRRGGLISDFEILIGAIALHYDDLTLLTYNTRYFRHIPDLKLYAPAA